MHQFRVSGLKGVCRAARSHPTLSQRRSRQLDRRAAAYPLADVHAIMEAFNEFAEEQAI
jgi:hypothetical protein